MHLLSSLPSLARACSSPLVLASPSSLPRALPHSGNILLSHFEEDTLPISGSVVNPLTLSCPQRPLLRIKLADFGLACSFNPLRAWLDLRALGMRERREGKSDQRRIMNVQRRNLAGPIASQSAFRRIGRASNKTQKLIKVSKGTAFSSSVSAFPSSSSLLF